jgi:NAD(P)-dependent dehydrogenase (short-subunit alcohol dehydrogenase family)
MSTSNRIALVTGSSRGLGKSMALHLAERGVDLILTYRSKEQEAKEVAAQIEGKGRKAVALPLDVGSSKTFPAFAEAVKERLGAVWGRERLDILVNNAGMGVHAS